MLRFGDVLNKAYDEARLRAFMFCLSNLARCVRRNSGCRRNNARAWGARARFALADQKLNEDQELFMLRFGDVLNKVYDEARLRAFMFCLSKLVRCVRRNSGCRRNNAGCITCSCYWEAGARRDMRATSRKSMRLCLWRPRHSFFREC